MKIQQRLVVIGGFGAGIELLEGVANAAHGLGLAVQDADVFRFVDAMRRPATVADAVGVAALTITHSAGILALSPAIWKRAGICAGQEETPVLTAYNGPEVSAILRLLGSGAVEGGRLMGRVAKASGLGTVARALANAGDSFLSDMMHLSTISSASTAGRLAACREEGVEVDAVVMDGDLIFPQDTRSYVKTGVPVSVQHGDHNELLIRPEAVLGQWLAQRLPDSGVQAPAA